MRNGVRQLPDVSPAPRLRGVRLTHRNVSSDQCQHHEGGDDNDKRLHAVRAKGEQPAEKPKCGKED